MSYGKIGFEHVWTFQIKCMMANQYKRLLEAIRDNSVDGVIAVCLRLGWNDAFKHVSQNVPDGDMLSECAKRGWLDIFDGRKKAVVPGMSGFKISDVEKDELAFRICETLVEDFKGYAVLTNTGDRVKQINDLLETSVFKDKFTPYKNISSSTYPLCFGHVQKMFNMAMKLLLCLIISAEHASFHKLTVKLGTLGSDDVFLTNNGVLSIKRYTYCRKLFAFDSADCPVDNIILKEIDEKSSKTSKQKKLDIGKTKYENIVWSKLGAPKTVKNAEDVDNYEKVQKEIAEIQKGTGKSNLCFDFENWNVRTEGKE